MTGKRIRKSGSFSSSLSIRALSLAVLATMVALAALAQQAGTGRPPARSSAASAPVQPGTPAQAQFHPQLPGIANAQRTSADGLRRTTKSAATVSESVSFKTAVT
jgi:hypothetical protein